MSSDSRLDAHLADIARAAERRAVRRARLGERLGAHGIALHDIELGRFGSECAWRLYVSTRTGELCTLSLPTETGAVEDTATDAMLDRLVTMTLAALDDRLGAADDEGGCLAVLPEVVTQRDELLAFRTLLASSLAPSGVEVESAAPHRTPGGVRWVVRMRGRGIAATTLRLPALPAWCSAAALANVAERVLHYARVYRTTEARTIAGNAPLPREFYPWDGWNQSPEAAVAWWSLFRTVLAARGTATMVLAYEGTGALAGVYRFRASYRPAEIDSPDVRAWVEVDVRAPSGGTLTELGTIEAVHRKVADLTMGGHL